MSRGIKKSKKPFVHTKKPKDVYRKIVETKICDTEHRKVLFEYMKMSLKEHYHTIFGEFNDEQIQFAFDEDATLLIKIYPIQNEWDAPYVFEVWKIMARIPLDKMDEWCFESFIEEMG